MSQPKLIKVGLAIFVSATAVGVMPTVIGMITAFNKASEKGSTDPAELSSDIGYAMTLTAAMMPVAAIGICMLIGGLIMPSRRYGKWKRG